MRLPVLLVGAALALGCAPPGGEETGDSNGALFAVPRPSDRRDVILSDIPALSRDADERRRGVSDATIATWHVHHVSTPSGFSGIVVYGADEPGLVRLSIVVDDLVGNLVVVEPTAEQTSEDDPAVVAVQTNEPIAPERLQWIGDELARLGTLVPKGDSTGSAQLHTLPKSTWICAARVTTMVLSTAAAFVITPLGGIIVSAAEAAAWGDFGGAATIGAIQGAAQTTTAMQASSSAAVRQAGGALKGLGVVGLVGAVGLTGVALVLDPKAAAAMLVPPQCK